MLVRDVVDVMWEVAATDPAMCDADDLTALAISTQRLRCWLDSVDAAIAVRADELARAGSGAPACMVMTAGGRRSAREIEVVTERAAVCAVMPEVHAALAAGTVSAGHADAIARVVTIARLRRLIVQADTAFQHPLLDLATRAEAVLGQ